ncbi:t-SNARE [Lipomyces oligophaga]|uniref:t-SNARE n=1 Tax=Lipomyces oligophaga TaxID=45792 RepID=UPI0034CFD042
MTDPHEGPFGRGQAYEMTDISHIGKQQRVPGYASSDSELEAFLNEVSDLRTSIVRYRAQVDAIVGGQRQLLMTLDSSELTELQHNIDSRAASASADAQDIKARIRSAEKRAQKAYRRSRDPTEKNQIESVKADFKAAMLDYQREEGEFRRRYKENVKRQLAIVMPQASESDLNAYVDNHEQGGQVFAQALQQSNRRGEAMAALEQVQARNQEIQQIERTILELRDIFEEMNKMLEEEGEELEIVDEQQHEALTQMEQGNVHAGKAVEHAKNARKWKWWAIALGLVIAIVIAVPVGIKIYNDNKKN